MLADHSPHQLAVQWYYTQILLIAVIALVVVVGLIAGSNRPVRSRALLGAGIGLAVVLPTMTWGYCSDTRVQLGLLVALLTTPALVALSHRWVPRWIADGSFVVAVVAVLGLFLVGQSRGCWRDQSYFSYNPNFYLALVAVPMVASWLFAWAWSHPTRARSILRQLASLPNEAAVPLARIQAAKDERAARPVPSTAQVQRAHALARMAILPMVVGAILISTVLGAPPGVVVFLSAWFVHRASRPVRAGQSQWSVPGVIALAIAALLTACGGSWLLIWAIQEDFYFTNDLSYIGLLFGLGWSAVFTVLIVRSLVDRRQGKRSDSSVVRSSDADSVSRQ